MIYLASPYSHTDLAIQEQRYKETLKLSAELMRLGYSIFSPIVYGHQFVLSGLQGGTADDWLCFNMEMFSLCRTVLVHQLPGWSESKGVALELEWASQQQKPVRFVAVL